MLEGNYGGMTLEILIGDAILGILWEKLQIKENNAGIIKLFTYLSNNMETK